MRYPIHLLLLLVATLLGFAASPTVDLSKAGRSNHPTTSPAEDSSKAPHPNNLTSLSGTVRDAESRKALAGASLLVFQQEKRVAKVLADTAGRFSLKLQHGTYTIECAYAGYVTVRFPRIETLENQDRVLLIRLEASTGLDELVVKNYQTPDKPEPREVVAIPEPEPELRRDGVAYDTVVVFDPETYEEVIKVVPRGTPAMSEVVVKKAAPSPPTSKSEPAGAVIYTGKMGRGEYKTAAKPMSSGAIRGSAGEARRKDAPATYSAPAHVPKSKAPATVPPPPPVEVAKGATPAPAPDGDDIIVVDGVKKRAVIAFDPETYEEKITLMDLDGTAPTAADITDKTPAPPPTEPAKPRAGLLTAGEWNDLHNWNRHWLDLLNDGEIEVHQKTYGFTPRYRYTVMLTNEQDFPLADAVVTLKGSGGETIWEARTDNTGKAELWKGLTPDPSPKGEGSLKVVAVIDGKIHKLGSPKEAAAGINRHRIAAECNAPRNVDIVWAVDATGSMGDEIEYLKTELLDVIGRAKALNGDLSFRMGTTFYRDEGDEYITKSSGLSYDISKTVDFIRQQRAGGGGDMPEAVHSALEEAIFNQKWSDRAIARICFLVLDASPHQTPEVNASLHRCIREAARRGIRVVPVAASGIQKDTEFLMKFFGLATNGTYVFLTDHSGIGGKHLEPTTDEYKVETLNDLLVRLIGEYTAIETCEGKSAIRFEGDDQQQPGQTWQALYYPNPASTQFVLELPFEVQSVTLYDAEGKAARKLESPQAGLNTIAVNDLADGFYTIRILKDGRMQSGKVLVVKGL